MGENISSLTSWTLDVGYDLLVSKQVFAIFHLFLQLCICIFIKINKQIKSIRNPQVMASVSWIATRYIRGSQIKEICHINNVDQRNNNSSVDYQILNRKLYTKDRQTAAKYNNPQIKICMDIKYIVTVLYMFASC